MAFTTEDITVQQLMTQVVYTIPRNQRKYVWDERNWKEMLEDILFATHEGTQNHFFGSIVLKQERSENGLTMLSIIDGQQRTISILLLLAAVEQFFKENNAKPQFDGLEPYLRSKDLNSVEHVKVSSEYYPLLDSVVNSVCDWESSVHIVNQRETPPKSEQCILDCLSFFYNSIKDISLNEIERIRLSLLESRVVRITATTEEDAYTVFEILNARGQVLEDHELLKNYIMRYIQPVSLKDTVKERWHDSVETQLGDYLSKFMQHYVVHRYPQHENLSPYGIVKLNSTPDSVNDLLNDFCTKAGYYKKIVMMADDVEYNSTEKKVFGFLYSNRGELFRPILLSLMALKASASITEERYNETLIFIRDFFVCYNILGRETSNKISEMVRKYAYTLSHSYSQSLYNDFIQSMLRRLPRNDVFIRSFKTIGWSRHAGFYSSGDKKRARIALETYEKILSGEESIGDFTIEHIHPDSNSHDGGNIGNLVILESELNERCKDKPLSEKLPIYAQSSFISPVQFSQLFSDRPESFNVDERASLMASTILDNLNSNLLASPATQSPIADDVLSQ